MKYETPELTALTAIDVVQSAPPKAMTLQHRDSTGSNELSGAYEDWE